MVTYGVLGVGSIATAMVVGLSGGDQPPIVVLSPRNAERAAVLADRFPGVAVATDNQAVVDASDVIVVCLRPDHADEVLAGLVFRPEQAVVSAMAGVSLGRLRSLLSPVGDIARSVPLPAVASRASVTPVHPSTPAAVELFDRLGGALPVADERVFEALVVASATVAASLDFLGVVSGWLAEHGVDGADAHRYVADQFAALVPELRTEATDFATLARAHATSGGLNEQFASHLRSKGSVKAVRDGLDALLARVRAAASARGPGAAPPGPGRP